ncbi:LPS export ABC transporter permease LptG [Thiocystis violacea]|uniref:LPS export ABC transporter permease LptG n=1 Tax=Thiocystis violacea TaxID=13725 RepID=UPI0019031E6F|nr:LPS export ABC transporter permease LptG [Thiocystis violacea]
MRILDRYLAWSVIGGTLLTLGVLVPLMGVFILADEVESIGVEHYGFLDAFLFMLLSLPRYLYQVFPIATLIGALIGLGTLASRSELVAIRAAGFSLAQIVRAALLGGVLLAVVAVVLGEVVAPFAEQRAVELRRQALSGDVAQRTPYGFWAIDDGAYVNIRDVRSGTSLSEIDIYRIDAEKGSLVATHAESASYRGGHWELEGIATSQVSTDGVEVERVERRRWDSMLAPDLLKVIVADPQGLPIWGLYKYIRFMTVNKQDAGAYEIAFWGKALHPVLTLSMILVAIPLLLGSSRSSGIGRRIFAGALVGILYYLLSRTFAYMALVFGMSPFLAAIAPPTLFISAALLLLRRLG